MKFDKLVNIFLVLVLLQCQWVEARNCSSSNVVIAFNNYNNTVQNITKTLQNYQASRLELDDLEGIISNGCQSIAQHQPILKKFSGLFKLIKLFTPLSGFIQPMEDVLGKASDRIWNNATISFCGATKAIYQNFEKFDNEVNKPLLNLTTHIAERNDYYRTLIQQVVLQHGMKFKEVCQESRIDARLDKICGAIADLQFFVGPAYESLTNFSEDVKDLEFVLKGIVGTFVWPVLELFGELDDIFGSIEHLFKEKFSILPGDHSLSRGVGQVASCCGRGYEYLYGKCYENCEEGYEAQGLQCIGKCPVGWSVTQIYYCEKEDTFERSRRDMQMRSNGVAPSAFPQAACACRTDGHVHFANGLCYDNQCGEEEFAGFTSAQQDRCWNFSYELLTVEEVVEQVDSFSNVSWILGLETAVQSIDKSINQEFSGRFTNQIKEISKMDVPSLPPSYTTILSFSIPDQHVPTFDSYLQQLTNTLENYIDPSQFSC